MNDLPTIERSLPLEGYVNVTFGASGTITLEANTAGGNFQVLDSSNCRVWPAGPTNYGHMDVKITDALGEVGRARVVFLIPVSFS